MKVKTHRKEGKKKPVDQGAYFSHKKPRLQMNHTFSASSKKKT